MGTKLPLNYIASFCRAMVAGHGEDCFCHAFCDTAGLVAVFDGCGGAGARKHGYYSDRTEAFMASRFCAGVFYDQFRRCYPSELTAEQFITDKLAPAVKERLQEYQPPKEPGSYEVLGSMVRTLPTTAAAALIRQAPDGSQSVSAIWAGDSRIYILDEDGLAQLTQDHTSVPDPMENLYEDGYKVMAGNLYSSHYPRYNKRARNESFLGGEVSTWCAINEESLGANGKLWDVMYSAEMLWNPERYDDSHRKAISYVISKYIQPKMRDLIRNKYSAYGYAETEFELPEGESTLEGIPIPLLCACPFAKLADGMSVSVGGKYERFAIEHTALEKEMRPLRGGHVLSGEYTLTYFDGSEYKAKVEYGKHVMKYDTSYAQPYPEAFYRHFGYVGTWYCDPIFKGKTDDGADLLVMSYILENPYPEKTVESISYKAAEDDVTNIVLCAVKGMNKNI
jgi:hypothetical protein